MLNCSTTRSGVAPVARASSLVARSPLALLYTVRRRVSGYGTSNLARDERALSAVRRQPDKTRTKVRSILIEVRPKSAVMNSDTTPPAGEIGSSVCSLRFADRYHSLDCQICVCTPSWHDLCRYALCISESLTKHDRLTGKQIVGPLRIDWLVNTVDRISPGSMSSR